MSVPHIPPELLADVLREIETEHPFSDSYSVPIEGLFERLIAKGWQPDTPPLQ